MKTLQEEIDELDQMVFSEAPKDVIRSKIRHIACEVAALEAENAGLMGATAQSVEEISALKTENANLAAKEQQPEAAPPAATTRRLDENEEPPGVPIV